MRIIFNFKFLIEVARIPRPLCGGDESDTRF